MYNYTEKTVHRVQQKLIDEKLHEACKRHELNNIDVHRIYSYEKCAHTS